MENKTESQAGVQCIVSGRDEPPRLPGATKQSPVQWTSVCWSGIINYYLEEQSFHYLMLDIFARKIKVFQTVNN